ncbi:MAG: T9SS type A sorting domain-containing protein [Candidatus Kapaibacterium sp.]
MGNILRPLLLVLAFTGISEAQVSSPAFDPNCYFPRIGVAGEIDTIYGWQVDQELGAGMLNIGAAPDSSYGRISCVVDHDTAKQIWRDSVFNTGPNFNLHKLNTIGKFILPPYYNIVRFAHFRSQRYRDILATASSRSAIILWQDDQGNYDSSRYTELWSSKRGTNFTFLDDMVPYSAHISSDMVEDIIGSAVLLDSGSSHGDAYLIYFKGGEQLKTQGKIAISDSMYSMDSASKFLQIAEKSPAQGDFRSVGREDLLQSDQYGNIMYFKNDPPFSMRKFLDGLRFDTLIAQRQNPNSIGGPVAFTMKALPKLPGDSSVDLFAQFNTYYGTKGIQEFRIFKGGEEFGSHRLTVDSAALVIHEPYYYDDRFNLLSFGVGIRDCGTMTGTHNRVLYIGAGLDGGFYGYHFFYVLGTAADDKADMVIGAIPNYGVAGNQVDTLVADKDGYQDIIMGLSDYGPGTIYLVHGTNNIPDRTNSVSSRKSVDESPSHILAYPNPCDEHTVLTFDNCSASRMQVQVISANGAIIRQEETPIVDGLQEYAVDLSTVAAGNYIVSLSCPANGWSSSVHVIKQGAAVSPWNLDLKKMVGR